MRRRRRAPLAAAAGLMLTAALAAGTPAAGARTWYVRAGAGARAIGSARHPFASLAAVQAASHPGDTIVVDPAASPLDGGIALQPRQRLIGAGAPVAGRTKRLRKLPAVENTTGMNLDGDAIRLADGVTVRNIAIPDASRGAIYGLDTTGVRIVGDDVARMNTSCTLGFLVQPFNVPTGLPSTTVPASPAVAPQNGWAGIMVDGALAAGWVDIEGNYIHDGDCGDGIDIRAMGSSDLTATVSGNTITRLPQGSGLSSVLAIGMQALDAARLRVTQDRDTETYIGSTGADCEGQFANVAGSGVVIDRVNRNTFAHAIGGSSCNGFETIISSGGGTIVADLSNSSFRDNVGDMFEEGNLGTGSTMRFTAQGVIADGTSVRGGNPPTSSDGGTNPIPFNIGDCMVAGDDGAGDSTTLIVRDSLFTHCNNGISLGNNAGMTNGSGPAEALVLGIAHSTITHNAKYGIHVYTATPLTLLHAAIQSSSITLNGEPGASFESTAEGKPADDRIDLGAGPLGSPGGNCLSGNGSDDVEATLLSVTAGLDWWGHPGGPAAGQTTTRETGTLTTDAGLPSMPSCGRG